MQSHPPKTPWETTWQNATDRIKTAQNNLTQHNQTRLPVQRINILEASVLDDEMFQLLELSFATVFGGARAMEQSAGPTSTWRRLLGLGIRVLYTGATVVTNTPTPGQLLQNVRYRNERLFQDPRTVGVLQLPGDGPTRMQRLCWMLLNVVLPYAWSSIRHRLILWLGHLLRAHRAKHAQERHDQTTIADHRHAQPPEVAVGQWIDYVEGAWGMASLFNVMVFFQNGIYTSLTDRLLSMRQVPSRGGGTRMLNFDFQNRQIVFSELNYFAMYVLPMLRVYSTLRAGRRMTARLAGRLKRLGRHVGVLSRVDDRVASKEVQENTAGEVLMKVDDCAYCGDSPASMPHVTSCGCTMCFYCLRTHVDPVLSSQGNVEASCPSCGQRMKWSRRWEQMFGELKNDPD